MLLVASAIVLGFGVLNAIAPDFDAFMSRMY